MELQTKKFYLVWFARKKKKFGDDNRCNFASYEKNKRFTQIFSNQKILNFLYTIYTHCVLMENKFFIFYLMGKNLKKKKLRKIFPCYFPIRKFLSTIWLYKNFYNANKSIVFKCYYKIATLSPNNLCFQVFWRTNWTHTWTIRTNLRVSDLLLSSRGTGSKGVVTQPDSRLKPN
jgi:hypothetical protein